MVVLLFLAYVSIVIFIGRKLSKKTRYGANVFIVVFCGWPLVEVLVVPLLVLQMNCDLAESVVHKTVRASELYLRHCNQECLNMILDDQYKEIQTSLYREADGSLVSNKQNIFSLYKVQNVSRDCALGHTVLDGEIERGAGCVGAKIIPDITARYRKLSYRRPAIREHGTELWANGVQFVDSLSGEVLANYNTIVIQKVLLPVQEFVNYNFGIMPYGYCDADIIDYTEVFMPQIRGHKPN